MFFRDMNNEASNEIHCWNALSYGLIVFVPGVMKSNHITIVIINTRSSDYRATKVTTDIFDCYIRSTFVWLRSDIETIRIFFV